MSCRCNRTMSPAGGSYDPRANITLGYINRARNLWFAAQQLRDLDVLTTLLLLN